MIPLHYHALVLLIIELHTKINDPRRARVIHESMSWARRGRRCRGTAFGRVVAVVVCVWAREGGAVRDHCRKIALVGFKFAFSGSEDQRLLH